MTTEVEVTKTKNARPDEREAFLKAAEEFEFEINSAGFWYEVEQVYGTWRHTNNLSFQEFKDLFLSGRDKFETEDDFNIRIRVEFYYSFKKVVGYTYPSTWWTWINRNLFKGFDLGDIAGNQSHEYCHNLNFGHPNTDRGSLTYMFGYLIRDRIKGRLGLTRNAKPVMRRSVWSRVRSFFSRIF